MVEFLKLKLNIINGNITTEEYNKNINCLKTITYTSQSSQKCIECPIKGGCGWCSGCNYEYLGTPNKRLTNICVMHQARVLANRYFHNKICNLVNRQDDYAKIIAEAIIENLNK